MITIIDYGLGNLASVANALEKLGVPYRISSNPTSLLGAKALILPGVGAAGWGMENLRKRQLDQVISKRIKEGAPLLGICLGMQLLLTKSEEGEADCLRMIKGTTKKFTTSLKVPHIGWNSVGKRSDSRLLKGIKNNSYFYFVNSYYCFPTDVKIVTGVTNYDISFCSVFESQNIYGVQFHPEKSGEVGLQLLKNFIETL